MLRFSLSGVPRKEDFAIRVDGVTVNGKWEFRDGIGLDRWHYDIMFFEAEEGNGGLSEGEHELEFELLSPWWDGVAQLCSVEVLEYGSEDE